MNSNEQRKQPSFFDDEMREFLNNLREEGTTNMFGAGPYLQEEFGLNQKEAREALLYWMETFEG